MSTLLKFFLDRLQRTREMAEKRNKHSFGIDPAIVKKFNWDRSRSHVLADMKTDFIFAPHIRCIFKDSFDDLKSELRSELENGKFSPSIPVTMEVPKSTRMRSVSLKRLGPSFSRPGSILMPKDRLLYQLIADDLASILDQNTDKSRSFSNWIAGSEHEGKFFVPSRICWNEMQERLRVLSEHRTTKYVVKLDVASCFSSINQHTLINFLKHIGCSEAHCAPLENILVKFTGDRNSRGIIQGVFPSDLLGNFYLTPIDQLLSDMKVPSVRYVDDIYIFVRSFDHAERIIRDITRELRVYDLYLNEYKSSIMAASALFTEEPDLEALFEDAIDEVESQFTHDEISSDYGFQTEFDDEVPEVTETPDKELIATQRLFDSANQYEGSEEKIERFCLPLFAKAESDYAIDHVISNLVIRPSMAQLYGMYASKFLKDEVVLRNHIEKSIIEDELFFDWQKMWLISSLIAGGVGGDNLVLWCLELVVQSKCHDALKAVAAIYVCRFGNFMRRKSICGEYSNSSPYVQSAILYGSRYFPSSERRNAVTNWAGHGYMHGLIAQTLTGQ